MAYLWCRYLSGINPTPQVQDQCDLFRKRQYNVRNGILEKSILFCYNWNHFIFYIRNAPLRWNLMSTLAKCSEFPGLRIFWISDIPNFRISNFTIFPFSNFATFRFSKFPIFRFSNFIMSDFSNFQFSEFWVFQLSDFPNFRFSNFAIF